MNTYFAPAERADKNRLAIDIETASENPVINEILAVASGMIAVLNECRQIISINSTLLKMMGIDDPAAALGLRPGEFLHCIHAHQTEGGCGTSSYCRTCGAAIAIVSSLENDTITEEKCTLTIDLAHQKKELLFTVKACPIHLNSKKYILIFLHDITEQQNLAMTGRVFFHDLRNILTSLVMASDIMQKDQNGPAPELLDQMHRLIFQLHQEVKIQECLTNSGHADYITDKQDIHCTDICNYLTQYFQHHTSSRKKTFVLPERMPDISLHTDSTLLFRVLTNMLINAFEASDPGNFVKLSIAGTPDAVTFAVWNKKYIPEKYQQRIFQRNFSTKAQAGRGIGTYSMKFFGEHYLNGKIEFTSTENEGTCFLFTVPLV
ncbi:MAG: HAMP domain-containing histidine kinase [Spirochaetales bacterium]|nr:HAMP domain-containing histidine kinase [Spirochaetales bacterium]